MESSRVSCREGMSATFVRRCRAESTVGYSYLSAVIGSIPSARRVGAQDESSPRTKIVARTASRVRGSRGEDPYTTLASTCPTPSATTKPIKEPVASSTAILPSTRRAVRREPTESGDSLGDQRTFPGSLESNRIHDGDLLAAVSSISRHCVLQSGTYLSVLKTGRKKRPT